MRYLIYKSTDLLDNILLGETNDCHFVRITDQHLKSRLFNLLMKFARDKNLFFPFLFKLMPGFSALRLTSKNDTIIVFDIADITLIKYIKGSICKDCKFHTFFWNPVSKLFTNEKQRIQELKDLGCNISTFDRDDAIKYEITYKDQFIRKKDIPHTSIASYDYYFLGFPKGRIDTLRLITNKLSNIGKVGKCIVPESKEQQITYEENIKYVCQSHCIVEILQDGQTGITLRALEALIYHKKLITNSKDIVNYEFYNPKNIFIWDNQDEELIRNFLNEEMASISSDIIEKFSFCSWIKTFK